MSGTTTQVLNVSAFLGAEVFLGSLISGPRWTTGHSGPDSHLGEI